MFWWTQDEVLDTIAACRTDAFSGSRRKKWPGWTQLEA
jgi:hypothetical protein